MTLQSNVWYTFLFITAENDNKSSKKDAVTFSLSLQKSKNEIALSEY